MSAIKSVESNDSTPFHDNPCDNLLLIRKLAEFWTFLLDQLKRCVFNFRLSIRECKRFRYLFQFRIKFMLSYLHWDMDIITATLFTWHKISSSFNTHMRCGFLIGCDTGSRIINQRMLYWKAIHYCLCLEFSRNVIFNKKKFLHNMLLVV